MSNVRCDGHIAPWAPRGLIDLASFQSQAWPSIMSHWREQQGRQCLCEVASTIWKVLDQNGQVRLKQSVVSAVTLTEQSNLRREHSTADDRTRAVKPADVEISKEEEAARVKQALENPGPCSLDQELHAATRIPFRDWLPACIASRGHDLSYWRKRNGTRRRQRTAASRSISYSWATAARGKTAVYTLYAG